MKRTLLLAPALVAAFVLAGPSSARQSDLPGSRLSPEALAPNLGAALDSRLAQIALSVRTSGSGAALATARSQGFLVAQGKVRVVVHARAGHVAGARAAVRLAHGKVVITSGKLIEALVPPKSLQRLAASRFVVRVLPVKSAARRDHDGPADRCGPGVEPHRDQRGRRPSSCRSAPPCPTAPTDPFAEAGDGQATISFTPPASDGGDAILYYTATAYPGGRTASSTGSSITVHGLTNGVDVRVHRQRDEQRRHRAGVGVLERGDARRTVAARPRRSAVGEHEAGRAELLARRPADQPAPQRRRVLGRGGAEPRGARYAGGSSPSSADASAALKRASLACRSERRWISPSTAAHSPLPLRWSCSRWISSSSRQVRGVLGLVACPRRRDVLAHRA